jgi:hypothetical protein
MRSVGEEAKTEKSARGGAWTLGRSGAERAQEARESRKRPQGWLGQKPQENAGGAAQRPAAATRPCDEVIAALIAAIQARFGSSAIGLGACGIRFAETSYAHSA